VVVIAVCDQDAIQARHVTGGDRKLDHHRHVETAQQRINHHRRTATIDQEPSHAQPPQNRPLAGFEGLSAERLSLWSLGLTGHGWTLSLGLLFCPPSLNPALRPAA
jgi:hypothetical protein